MHGGWFRAAFGYLSGGLDSGDFTRDGAMAFLDCTATRIDGASPRADFTGGHFEHLHFNNAQING